MSTLKWKVINADKVEIDKGIGEVALEGMWEFYPYERITFTLMATNDDGRVQKSCTCEVYY